MVGPDPIEAEVKITTEAEVKVVRPTGVPDTHPHPQRPAVTAITGMGPTLGTVLPRLLVLGRTDVQLGHEGPADLERKKVKFLVTTLCFLR